MSTSGLPNDLMAVAAARKFNERMQGTPLEHTFISMDVFIDIVKAALAAQNATLDNIDTIVPMRTFEQLRSLAETKELRRIYGENREHANRSRRGIWRSGLMGYLRRHAIIVTNHGHGDFLVRAHSRAAEIFPWVSAISPPATNSESSFFIPPDGSKEGCEESNKGDDRRDEFIAWLRTICYEDGSSPLSWCEIQYGDDSGENTVTRADDMNEKIS